MRLIFAFFIFAIFFLLQISEQAFGQVIGRDEAFELNGVSYRVVRMIGEGSYAKIYRAEAFINGKLQIVAIKPFFEDRNSPAFRKELQDIYEKLKGLSGESAGLVKILDVGTTSVVTMDEMEYEFGEARKKAARRGSRAGREDREGRDAREGRGSRERIHNPQAQLKTRGLIVVMDLFEKDLILPELTPTTPTSEIARRFELVEKIVQSGQKAIQFLSENGMIHGDIKPSNFLINSTGDIHLSDFDQTTISNISPEALKHAVFIGVPTAPALGSPGFDPPEFNKGRGYLLASDTYSLGMTALYILTNHILHNFTPEVSVMKSLSETDHQRSLQLLKEYFEEFKTKIPLTPFQLVKLDEIQKFILESLAYRPKDRIKNLQNPHFGPLLGPLCSGVFR